MDIQEQSVSQVIVEYQVFLVTQVLADIVVNQESLAIHLIQE